MKSQGLDPADYVGADDLGRLLGDDFTVELHAVEPRIDPPPGAAHHRRRRPARPASLTARPCVGGRTGTPEVPVDRGALTL